MQIAQTTTSTDDSRPSVGLLYARLAADLRTQMDRGVLRPGERLPSVRTLSQERGVSVSTVMQAYISLEEQGRVIARDRSGYYVSAPEAAYPAPTTPKAAVTPSSIGIADVVSQVLARNSETNLVPLGISAPGPSLLPLRRLNREIRAVLSDQPEHSAYYGEVAGEMALRRQIARRAFAAGCNLDPGDIVVTAGGLEALNLCLRAAVRPGDVIAVESPTYFGILQAAEALGLRVAEVPADPGTGIRLDLLERAILRHRAKAVVSMTTSHNPLGCTLTPSARADLVGLITRHQVPLIEDDVYGDLAFGETRPPAAKSLDTEDLVMLCSSFSKTLAPGLRLGWTEAGRFRDRVRFLKSITTAATPTLTQLGVARLLEDGFFERHVRRLRRGLGEQIARYLHEVSVAFPEGTRLARPKGGNLLWIQLPKGVDGTEVYRRSLQQGITVMPGEIFSARGRHREFIRLSCGTAWSNRIEQAIGTVGQIIRRLA